MRDKGKATIQIPCSESTCEVILSVPFDAPIPKQPWTCPTHQAAIEEQQANEMAGHYSLEFERKQIAHLTNALTLIENAMHKKPSSDITNNTTDPEPNPNN